MQHRHASAISFPVEKTTVDVIIVVRIIGENEGESRVYVNNDHAEHRRHHKRLAVHGHGLDDVLELGEPVDDVGQMTAVEDRALDKALQREDHVAQTEDEVRVLHQETQADPEILELERKESKASLTPFVEG